MSSPYIRELHFARLAVQRASIATKAIVSSFDKGTLSKDDHTPVTVADFAAQALLISAIHDAFPSDQFIGEESATALRSNDKLRSRVWELVSSTRLADEEAEATLARPKDEAEMMDVIDLGGNGQGGRKGRFWILDPVDGTATFMNGEQYAVALGLVEDGVQKVGVLGLPNVPASAERITEGNVDARGMGVMLFAVAGKGACKAPMSRGSLMTEERITVRENVEQEIGVHFVNQRGDTLDVKRHRMVGEKLGASWPGTELWAAQVRYSALAVGGGDVLLRIPLRLTARQNSFDHIGGMLIFEEVGGKITDMEGKSIDFGAGRKLASNFGIVAARKDIHAKVLSIVKEVIADASFDGRS